MSPRHRPQLALDTLAGHAGSNRAQQHPVSRTCVYQQLRQAHDALDQAFAPAPPAHEAVRFYLPVPTAGLGQFVRSLLLIGPSSLRGLSEGLAARFDYRLSLGSVQHLRQPAGATARRLKEQADWSRIRRGAQDEIFPAGPPVVVGADGASPSCYRLRLAEHRDAATWSVRLLELVDRGFQPQATIADVAGGLPAAPAEVLPAVPCRGAVFLGSTRPSRGGASETPGQRCTPGWLPCGGRAKRRARSASGRCGACRRTSAAR